MVVHPGVGLSSKCILFTSMSKTDELALSVFQPVVDFISSCCLISPFDLTRWAWSLADAGILRSGVPQHVNCPRVSTSFLLARWVSSND
jgi:hypothetical protein